MPYSGPEDPSLPSNVKKMPAKKRRQWVDVFNSAIGKGDEASAFAQANGVAGKKEDEVEEKMGDYEMSQSSAPMLVQEVNERPLGGATTFSAAEDFRKAAEREYRIQDHEHTFHCIFRNIMEHDAPLAEKAASVEAAARELAERIRLGVDVLGEKNKPSLISRIKTGIFGMKPETPTTDYTPQAFFVTQSKDQSWRWLALVSNKFYDKEGEVFPESVHQEYVSYVDSSKEYPELWLWHTPGSRIGQADFVAYADGFLLASGVFDPGQEGAAAALASKGSELGVSHGYVYPEQALDKATGAYSFYRMFEVSPLPADRSANAWTAFNANAKEVQEAMALAPEKRTFLAGILGEDKTKAIEESVASFSKELEDAGVSWKELGDALSSEPPEKKDDEDEKKDEVPAVSAAVPTAEPAAAAAPETPAPATAGEAGAPTESETILAGVKSLLADAMTGVNDQIAAIKADVDALKQTDDEKVAAAVAPRAAAVMATRASQSESTLVADQEGATEATKSLGNPADSDDHVRPYVDDLLAGRVIRGQ